MITIGSSATLLTDEQVVGLLIALLFGVVAASLIVCWPAVDRAVRRYLREEVHRPADPWCLRHRGRAHRRPAGPVPCCLVCSRMDDHVWQRLRAEQSARLAACRAGARR